MLAVKPLLGYPGLRPTFFKRTGGVLNACLLDRPVWGQWIIFQPETRIIPRGWLGFSATNRPASAFALRWERYRVIGALPCPAKKGADPTITWASARNAVDWTSPSCATLTTRCAHNTQVHLLQTLADKRARASLSAHSSLVALCSLVLSQGGQCGLRTLPQRHPVEGLGVRVSRPGSRMSAVVLTPPSMAGAGISECSAVVSPASRASPRGQGSALAFGLLEKLAFPLPLAHLASPLLY